MGIEAGEEVQAKGLCNIFNKIIIENYNSNKKYNNNRKIPKSKESYAHSGTGNLQDTKQI
jgi:hypothetical protein